MNLYAVAVIRIGRQHSAITPLFRDIFKDAYLPYSRLYATLRAGREVMDEFTYDHSERLVDAFEYRLSVRGLAA